MPLARNTDDKKASLSQAGHIVCGELPEGWTLVLSMERGAAWVSLIDPHDFDVVLPDSTDKTLEEQVDDALRVATGSQMED